MLIAGLDIPEYNSRQLVAVVSVHCLCLLKIAEGSIPCAGVKLHVGNNIQSSRQLLLRQTVLYCGLQDQLKDCLQVCIGTLIELQILIDEFFKAD